MEVTMICICKLICVAIIGISFFSEGQSAFTAVESRTPLAPATLQGASSDTELIWDDDIKTMEVPFGEPSAHFTFYFTNTSSSNITITAVNTSCGCTTAQLPSWPWVIPAGTNGQIGVTVNLAGKTGTLFKTATVKENITSKVLSVKIEILPPSTPYASPTNDLANFQTTSPGQTDGATLSSVPQTRDLPATEAMRDPDRARNFEMAKVDRQAIFKGECAVCHVNPAEGKYGKALFNTACGICHEGERRATMVPNLHALNFPTSFEYWQAVISHGKPNSLMPGFAKTAGGPLTDMQIISLASYLASAIPSHPNQAK